MVNVEFKTINKSTRAVYSEMFPLIGITYSPDTNETVLLLQGTRPRFACTGKEEHERLSSSLRKCISDPKTTLVSIGGRWYNNKEDFTNVEQFADTAEYNETLQYFARVVV